MKRKSDIITSISELYGVPKPQDDNAILLLAQGELLAITDILRDMTTNADTIKKIDELEKPFKKTLNSKKAE